MTTSRPGLQTGKAPSRAAAGRKAVAFRLAAVGLLAWIPIAGTWKAAQLAADGSSWAPVLAISLLAQGTLLLGLGRKFWAGLVAEPSPAPAEDHHLAPLEGPDLDATERDQARREVELTKRTHSELLANMSHELRTPINGILGISELMLKQDLGDGEREYVEIVRSSSGELLQVVEDILDFSQIEAGNLTLESEDFSLRELLDGVLEAMTPRAAAKHLELRLEVARGTPESLHGDPGRLRQLLCNLVSNAIKFTRQGGVLVTAERHAGAREIEVGFAVQDTGIGIAPEMRANLFAPFAQADGSASREHGGNGLGLAITQRVVELLGGTLDVDSTPAVGSTFFVTLPFSAPQSSSMPAPSAPVTHRAPRSRNAQKVLVVEDEKVNRMVAVRLLEQLGYRAEAVINGRAALEALERGSFDLVLMDCQMPELDGYATARRVRHRETEGQRLPIIAVTAHALRGDREKCLAAGMDDYLAKPFREHELATVLARWLAPKDDAQAQLSDTFVALDPATLETLLRLNHEAEDDFLSRAIQDFLQQESPKVDAMRQALGSDDSRHLMEAAHSLCGAAGSLGAFHLSKLCGELIDLAQYKTLAECRIRLQDVEREFARTVAELRQILGEPIRRASRRRSSLSA